MRGKREVLSELHLLFDPKNDGKKTVKYGNQTYPWSKTWSKASKQIAGKLPLQQL